MAAKHGTRHCYISGCRCDDCKAANRDYQRELPQRRVLGGDPVRTCDILSHLTPTPGPVEAGVEAEIGGLAADARPGLAQAALAMARILDNPRAVPTQPAAARQLVAILGMLSKRAHRRGKLAVVKSMTTIRVDGVKVCGPHAADANEG